jgi:ribosome-associated protein
MKNDSLRVVFKEADLSANSSLLGLHRAMMTLKSRCATLESAIGRKKNVQGHDCHRSGTTGGKAAVLKIDTGYIKLDSFLKATGMASSGGEAKLFISGGKVRVNGKPELRRGRKLYPGDTVEAAGAAEKVE